MNRKILPRPSKPVSSPVAPASSTFCRPTKLSAWRRESRNNQRKRERPSSREPVHLLRPYVFPVGSCQRLRAPGILPELCEVQESEPQSQRCLTVGHAG